MLTWAHKYKRTQTHTRTLTEANTRTRHKQTISHPEAIIRKHQQQQQQQKTGGTDVACRMAEKLAKRKTFKGLSHLPRCRPSPSHPLHSRRPLTEQQMKRAVAHKNNKLHWSIHRMSVTAASWATRVHLCVHQGLYESRPSEGWAGGAPACELELEQPEQGASWLAKLLRRLRLCPRVHSAPGKSQTFSHPNST